LKGPLDELRKVLELERDKRFSDSAVVGGLDAYLRRFLAQNPLPDGHQLLRVLAVLPPRGYASLHPIQRRRVVEALLKAIDRPAPAGRGPAVRAEARPSSPLRLHDPVSALQGVSRTYAQKLERLGVRSVGDLLYHFPHRYNDYSAVRPIARLVVGEEQTVIATVWTAAATSLGGRKATEAVVGDETGTLRLVWWGQTHVARQLRPRLQAAFSGRVTVFRGQIQMENPEWEPLDQESLSTRRLVPVYPSTEGLSQRFLRRLVHRALDACLGQVAEALPQPLRQRLGLMPIAEALHQVHFPDSRQRLEEARRRLAFEELLTVQLVVVRRRLEWQRGAEAPVLSLPANVLQGFISSLPFQLTGAQRRAIADVLADLARPLPMSRLLEGDVGSGKTVVAAAALLAAACSGWQGAIMAPTEILAEQHFRTLCRLLDAQGDGAADDGPWFTLAGPGYAVACPPYLERPLRLALLMGGLRPGDKAQAQEAIGRGEVDIAVGTHALIQEQVRFPRLGLAVIDEQHRFGVVQRAALREKGRSPHVLVMTATPIPRTLALTLYGDLDITVLDEMPPGRPPVKTYRLRPQQRQQAYDFIRRQVRQGRQAYIVCPLIEESEAVAARAAEAEYQRLSREVFPDLRLGLLHGRMPPRERDETMRRFRDGQLDVLVTTTVVEVGVDVPNATVILIEAADRFGLAQLHQLRGRVRRSQQQSFCLLLSENPSQEAQERLRIVETVHDGFRLAEEDLRLRGPGEYFGVRQSGLPDLKVASITDVALIELARQEAARLLEADPDLSRPEHRHLRQRVVPLWEGLKAEIS
jgi:ATP-dependent DNA helicase RecG